jgi:AraC-like DNA-binding protein
MNNIFVVGIFLAFFLQFLLLKKKNRILPDVILATWMFFIGLHLFSFYIHHLGYWEKYPHLSGIHHPFPLLHGPFLYLYVVFSLRTDKRFRWKDYAHFLPAILSYLYMMPYFLLYTAAEKRMVDSGQMNDYGVFMYVSLVAFIISGITYPILAFRLIGRYEKMIHENFAFDEKISLDWLRYSIGGLLVIFLTVALFSVLQHVANIELSFNPDFIYYSEIIAFIFFVGYYGIRHEGVVVDSSPTVSVKKIVNPKIEEVRTIGREDCSEVISKLMELMKSQQPYLDPELSLAKLSHLMQVKPETLSEVLNSYLNQNFFDFVNKHRIDDFKVICLDKDNKHLSIMGLAYECGFNSKAAFYRAFNKFEGISPTAYISKVSQ